MAIRHGRNLAIYVNGVDISGDLNEINPVSEMDMAEVATFGALNHQAYAGLAKDSGTIQAIYNSTEATIFQNLVQASTGYGAMILFQSIAPFTSSNTTWPTVYCAGEINLKSNSMKSIVTDINRATISFETKNYPFEPGKLIYYGSASTVAPIQDNGGSTLNGGAAYLQALAVGTTLNAKVLTSSTGAFAGEEATSATFATATTTGAQRVAISGTINRYSIVSISVVGVTTFAVGLVRY